MEQQVNAVQSESKEETSKKIVIVSRETSSRFVLMDFCFQDYTKSIAMIIEHSILEREQITKFRSVYALKYDMEVYENVASAGSANSN